jgi:hypothetical protein
MLSPTSRAHDAYGDEAVVRIKPRLRCSARSDSPSSSRQTRRGATTAMSRKRASAPAGPTLAFVISAAGPDARNQRQADLRHLNRGIRPQRTSPFCESGRQHVGVGWTLPALAFAQGGSSLPSAAGTCFARKAVVRGRPPTARRGYPRNHGSGYVEFNITACMLNARLC